MLNSFFLCGGRARPNSGVLNRPRLGTKIPGLLSAQSDRKTVRKNVSMLGRLVVSPPEKWGIPGCALVLYIGLSFSYLGSPAPEPEPAFSPARDREPRVATPSRLGRFLLHCIVGSS